MNEEKLSSLQAALGAEGLNGWLFYDFCGSDPIGRSILRAVYVDGADAIVTGLPVQSQVVPILGDGWRTFVRE